MISVYLLLDFSGQLAESSSLFREARHLPLATGGAQEVFVGPSEDD